MHRDSLQPKLEQAQQALDTALEEACGVDVSMANTGEMIRIEETLAIATNAAKEVVSVRLRRRSRKVGGRQREVSAQPSLDRVFDDQRGKRWHAYAVHPPFGSAQTAMLTDAFTTGWLCFETHDELRRLAPIPGNWHELPIDDLRNLCHKAERATKHS